MPFWTTGSPANGDGDEGRIPPPPGDSGEEGQDAPGETPDVSDLPTLRMALDELRQALAEQRRAEGDRHRGEARRLNRSAKMLAAFIENMRHQGSQQRALEGIPQSPALREELLQMIAETYESIGRAEADHERVLDEVRRHLLAADLLDKHGQERV